MDRKAERNGTDGSARREPRLSGAASGPPSDVTPEIVPAARLATAPEEPQRRCILTRRVAPKSALLRFVIGPQRQVVPDVTETLPGRGLWLCAERAVIEEAVRRRAFARAARGTAQAPEDLADQVEAMLVRRCVELLGLSRRAGQAVCGFAKVEAAARSGRVAVLVEAADGAADGRRKLRALAPQAALVASLSARELGLAFGRENVVHAGIGKGALAERFWRQAARLSSLRSAAVEALSGTGAGNPEPSSADTDGRLEPEAAHEKTSRRNANRKGTE